MKAYIINVEEACYDEPHKSILDNTVFKSKKSAKKAFLAKYEKWKNNHPAIAKKCVGTGAVLDDDYASLWDGGERLHLEIEEMKFVS